MVGMTASAKTTVVVHHNAPHPVFVHKQKPCDCRACKHMRMHAKDMHKGNKKCECKNCKKQMPPQHPQPQGHGNHNPQPQGHRK